MIAFDYVKFYASQVAFLLILVFISYYGGLKNLHYIDIYPNSFELLRFFLFICVTFFTSLLVFLKLSRFIELNIHLYIFVFFLPNFAFFVSGGGSALYITYFLIVSLYFLLFVSLFCFLFRSIPDLRPSRSFRIELLWFVLLLSIAVIALNFNYIDLQYKLQNVYTNRELISKGQFIGFEYLHMILSKAILPILLVIYLFRSAWSKVLICFGLYIILFFLTQHRAVFLIPFLLVFVALLSKWSINDKLFVPGIFLVISSIGLLLHFNQNTLLLGDIFIRRFFLDSPALNFAYLEFFGSNPFTYFTDSNLTLGAFESPYDTQIPYLISNKIGAYGGHANVGYFGSGFQHAGLFGVFLYCFLISFVIALVDYINRYNNAKVVFSIYFISFVWIYISTDLPSMLLTHGFAFLLFFNYLLRSKL